MKKAHLTNAQFERIVGFKNIVLVRQYSSTLFELFYPSGHSIMAIISILGVFRLSKYAIVDLVSEKARLQVDQLFKFPVDASKSYCTQNESNCSICSLVNYGRDCHNHSF